MIALSEYHDIWHVYTLGAVRYFRLIFSHEIQLLMTNKLKGVNTKSVKGGKRTPRFQKRWIGQKKGGGRGLVRKRYLIEL